eukprot:COSAG02_NODE_861_length_16429_cov_75.930680_4_plen_69_part_00
MNSGQPIPERSIDRAVAEDIPAVNEFDEVGGCVRRLDLVSRTGAGELVHGRRRRPVRRRCLSAGFVCV